MKTGVSSFALHMHATNRRRPLDCGEDAFFTCSTAHLCAAGAHFFLLPHLLITFSFFIHSSFFLSFFILSPSPYTSPFATFLSLPLSSLSLSLIPLSLSSLSLPLSFSLSLPLSNPSLSSLSLSHTSPSLIPLSHPSLVLLIQGVADGVGGWADQGVDPSLFAWGLMEACQKVCTTSTKAVPAWEVLKEGYANLVASKMVKAGKRKHARTL